MYVKEAVLWVPSLFTTIVIAFNVQVEEQTVNFILSPVIEAFAVFNSSGDIPQLPQSAKPSFFGYSFSIYSDAGNIRLMAGAPKTLDPKNPLLQHTSVPSAREPIGSIETCPISASFFDGKRPSCAAANPPNSKEGDSFGLGVPNALGNGNITACSAMRTQDCGAVRYNPGVCFSSDNYGKTWNGKQNTSTPRCPTTNVEVLFVLDGSGSIGTNFDKVKNWVKEISKKIGIDEGVVAVGVVQYSHYSSDFDIKKQPWIITEIKIGEYKTYESFASEVDKIKLHGYTTYTGRALEKVVTDFKNTPHHGKVSTKQVMILLTDGMATDRDLVAPNAQNIRDIGVLPFAVGVGDETEVNRTELQLIATGDAGNDTRVFMATNFDGLDAIAKELEAEIGGLVLEGGTRGQNGTGYNLQFGQLGLSIAYSKAASQIQRRDATSGMRHVILSSFLLCCFLVLCVWFRSGRENL